MAFWESFFTVHEVYLDVPAAAVDVDRKDGGLEYSCCTPQSKVLY
jgi:hypothetical protein